MRNTILIAGVSLIFLGCTKDKFSTTPQLTYKSANTDRLSPNQVIQFSLSFTDAEGDVVDTMYVQKVSLNCRASNFSERVPIPNFATNKNLKADVLVSYANGINNPPYTTIASRCNLNDTCYFRFMLKDKANNRSDTVRSETIVVFK